MTIKNPDLAHLMQTNPYFRIPAKSRPQSFAAYRLTRNIDTELQHFKKNFTYHYYIADLRVTKKDLVVIVIPFNEPIKSEESQTLDLEVIDQNFTRYEYGESFRTRSKLAQFLEVNPNNDELDPKEHIMDTNPHFDINQIKNGLKSYMKTTDFIKRVNDDINRRRFLESLANDAYKNIYSAHDVDTILTILSQKLNDVKTEYARANQDIHQSSAIRNKLNPFGQYLQLYQSGNKNHGISLGTQLLERMSSDFQPNAKLPLYKAGNVIAQVYQPSLLMQDGTDHDNVVIFNPLQGMWIHNEDVFMSLLTALRPYSKHQDLETMIDTFAADARNKNNFIAPYHESRYILFKNCVLDLRTKQQLPLDSTKVKNLHFTERMQIQINYNPNVIESPRFPGRLKAKHLPGNPNDAWDPYSFFMAYANNNPLKLKYFFFGLSLGLFPGHNFGVHFDIRGESRWGKTTLVNIFQGLYPKHVMQVVFAKLNEQFGLTNYNMDTSIIWVRECNNESAPLNNEYGTPYYDALADNQAQIQSKNHKDIIVDNPPQVYIDGTSYVKAEDMDTGPGGRTLPFKLPMDDGQYQPEHIKHLIDQAYGIGIENLLRNETVLQYLVNCMIDAYRTFLNLKNPDDLWNLQFNLGGRSSDISMFPPFVKVWREEMLQNQGDLADWFTYDFLPYFSKDSDNPQWMHNSLAYGFYSQSYNNKFGRQDPNGRFRLSQRNFDRQFDKLIRNAGWQKTNMKDKRGNKRRKSIRYLAKTNFQIKRYQNDGNQIPYEFTNESVDNNHRSSSYPLAQRTSGWYNVVIDPTINHNNNTPAPKDITNTNDNNQTSNNQK